MTNEDGTALVAVLLANTDSSVSAGVRIYETLMALDSLTTQLTVQAPKNPAQRQADQDDDEDFENDEHQDQPEDQIEDEDFDEDIQTNSIGRYTRMQALVKAGLLRAITKTLDDAASPALIKSCALGILARVLAFIKQRDGSVMAPHLTRTVVAVAADENDPVLFANACSCLGTMHLVPDRAGTPDSNATAMFVRRLDDKNPKISQAAFTALTTIFSAKSVHPNVLVQAEKADILQKLMRFVETDTVDTLALARIATSFLEYFISSGSPENVLRLVSHGIFKYAIDNIAIDSPMAIDSSFNSRDPVKLLAPYMKSLEHDPHHHDSNYPAIINALVQHGITTRLIKRLSDTEINSMRHDLDDTVALIEQTLQMHARGPSSPIIAELDANGSYERMDSVLHTTARYNYVLHRRCQTIISRYFEHRTGQADCSYIPNSANVEISKYEFLASSNLTPYSNVECQYLRLLNSFLEYPQWWNHINSPATLQHWRKVALAAGASSSEIDLAFSELSYLTKHHVHYSETTLATYSPATVKGVLMSDNAVTTQTQQSLISWMNILTTDSTHRTLLRLAQQSESAYPGIHISLVDPSMYPLIYNYTKVAPRYVRQAYPDTSIPFDILEKHQLPAASLLAESSIPPIAFGAQWIPTDISVKNDGTVEILSPINGLHPVWYRGAYADLARVFQGMVPMFERLRLANLLVGGYVKPLSNDDEDEDEDDEGGEDDEDEVWEDDEDVEEQDDEEQEEEEEEDEDEEEEEEQDEEEEGQDHEQEEDEEEEQERGVPVLPTEYPIPKDASDTQPINLKGRRLQIIVRIVNFELTPEKPTQAASVWQLDGAGNESIVATGAYTVDCTNVSHPCTYFTAPFSNAFQDLLNEDDEYVRQHYPIDDNNLINSRSQIGFVQAKPGRCIIFSNTWKHSITGFKLINPKEPGSIKLIIFHLVNPSKTLVSTQHLAPQQPDWYNIVLKDTKLPPELWSHVTQHIPGTLSLQQAVDYHHSDIRDRMRFTLVSSDLVQDHFLIPDFS